MQNFYIKEHGLKPADRIVTPKSNLGIIKHHAIYLGQNYQGIDLIIENKERIGVQIITADQFFSSQLSITRIEKFSGNGYERELAVKRALDSVGQPYSLINFNCESFANLVQHNHSRSGQAAAGIFFGLLALGLVVASSNNKKGRRS